MAADTPDYLRTVQYRDPDRLAARARLHRRYGRSDWFDWLAAETPWHVGGRCADIGCGAGTFWAAAPAMVPDSMALELIDLSPGMVDVAVAAARGAGRWRSVTGTVADAAALPLADGSIDTALTVHMLYHLADPAAGVRELARILAPGGTAVVVLNAAGSMAQLSALVDVALDRQPGVRAEPLTGEQCVPLLEAVFARVDLVRYDDRLVCTDPADVRDYLLSLPVADLPGAAERLTAAVDHAFAGGPLVIDKAAVLLRCGL